MEAAEEEEEAEDKLISLELMSMVKRTKTPMEDTQTGTREK